MARNHRDEHQTGADDGERSDLPALADDMLPDIWSTWMRFGVEMTQQWISLVQRGWHLPDQQAGDLLSAGTEKSTEHLGQDPLLKWIDQVWKTHPLHAVIPVDWTGIAWALRTVWLRSFTRPDVLRDLSALNAAIWRSALDVWDIAGRRWCGQISPDPLEATKSGDKRFAAPEWHNNPLYRTLRARQEINAQFGG
jgi:polyhydroxyalkanoate synthase